jgi:hypothetical protein
LSFIPEEFLVRNFIFDFRPEYWNGTVNKIAMLIVVGSIVALGQWLRLICRKKVILRGHNYKIVVEYGDLFDAKNCRKVINFDECFTTEMGTAPHQIKRTSICGQYLMRYPSIDIPKLLLDNKIKPKQKHSKFANKQCYESGTLIPKDDYLLMSFGILNKDGRAVMTREEYTDSLSTLWKELDKYYNQCDVAIPILGSGITRFEGEMLSQQQLVDIIVASYKLSPYKIKQPNSLRIVCRKNEEFSINKINENM